MPHENSLEKRMRDAINDTVGLSNELHSDEVKRAAQACAEIAREEMTSFAVWAAMTDFTNDADLLEPNAPIEKVRERCEKLVTLYTQQKQPS